MNAAIRINSCQPFESSCASESEAATSDRNVKAQNVCIPMFKRFRALKEDAALASSMCLTSIAHSCSAKNCRCKILSCLGHSLAGKVNTTSKLRALFHLLSFAGRHARGWDRVPPLQCSVTLNLKKLSCKALTRTEAMWFRGTNYIQTA